MMDIGDTFAFELAPFDAYERSIISATEGEEELPRAFSMKAEKLWLPERDIGLSRPLMGLKAGIGHLKTLGFITGDTSDVMNAVNGAMLADYVGMSLWSIYRGIILVQTAWETMWAGIETTANMIAQNWVGIAIAVGSTVAVASAFETGYLYGSGQWNFASVNISEPVERRKAVSQVASATAPVVA